MNLVRVMDELAKGRRIFHSEADFQHSLGWKIREIYPDARIKAEIKSFYSPKSSKEQSRRRSLDLLVMRKNQGTALELKYKTAEAGRIELLNEEFLVPREGAQDRTRYDFLSDLMRLEKAVSKKSGYTGYAILLTNDSLYWTPPQRDTKDADFRLHNHQRTISGRMFWRKDTAASTKEGREEPIVIKRKYPIKWRFYSKIPSTKKSEFRYLMIKIQ